MSAEIENGLIDSAFLGWEDHGCFACSIGIEFGCVHQAFGVYQLGNRTGGDDYGITFLAKLMNAVGVNEWSKLKGTHVRVKRDKHGDLIRAIGHIIEDKWFEPREFAKGYE